MQGEIVADRTFDARMADGPGFVLDAAIAVVRSLLDERGRGDGGRPHNATNLPDWGHFDVPGYVSRHFNVPVLVNNSANLVAPGEHLLRPAATEMIAVEGSTGIGAGPDWPRHPAPGNEVHCWRHWTYPRSARRRRSLCLPKQRMSCCPGWLHAIAKSLTAAGHKAENADDVVELARNGNLAAIGPLRQPDNDLGESWAPASISSTSK
ncbi:ROK family protein [Arthrobacter sp. ISL-85]|nr:ROK family protein [Arthrobacter sp. ISL-85]